jgi:hypothetical protein
VGVLVKNEISHSDSLRLAIHLVRHKCTDNAWVLRTRASQAVAEAPPPQSFNLCVHEASENGSLEIYRILNGVCNVLHPKMQSLVDEALDNEGILRDLATTIEEPMILRSDVGVPVALLVGSQMMPHCLMQSLPGLSHRDSAPLG